MKFYGQRIPEARHYSMFAKPAVLPSVYGLRGLGSYCDNQNAQLAVNIAGSIASGVAAGYAGSSDATQASRGKQTAVISQNVTGAFNQMCQDTQGQVGGGPISGGAGDAYINQIMAQQQAQTAALAASQQQSVLNLQAQQSVQQAEAKRQQTYLLAGVGVLAVGVLALAVLK